jgi:ABC-2 type transport system ATP-binding protein
MIIRTTDLTKKFGDFTAVDALSIAVEPGTVFAFLGANGSGKSTTIRMLIGLLQPTSGSIEVDGIDVIRHPRRVRDLVGYMGQKVSLYAGLSLRENVDFYAGLYGLSGNELEQRWAALAERFNLGAAESEKAESLPAGIRQRAGLALATLHQPRLLFLDEPTAGVDVHNRALFWEIIQDESTRGVTVFVTTHFLEEVEYCDWVSFIDRGRLIANAPPEDLRAEYADGYRIVIAVPEASRDRVGGALGSAAERTDAGFAVRARTLDAHQLALIDRQARSAGATAVHVEATPMTEVFRRVLTKQASAES